MRGPVFEGQTKEWRKLRNDGIQQQFQKPNRVKEIAERCLMWACHPRSKQVPIVQRVIEESHGGKRPIRRPKLRWENCVKKDVQKMDPEIRRREQPKKGLDGKICIQKYGLKAQRLRP